MHGIVLHACMTHAAQQLFLKCCLATCMRNADWIRTAALLRRAHVALQECCISLVARLWIRSLCCLALLVDFGEALVALCKL